MNSLKNIKIYLYDHEKHLKVTSLGMSVVILSIMQSIN